MKIRPLATLSVLASFISVSASFGVERPAEPILVNPALEINASLAPSPFNQNLSIPEISASAEGLDVLAAPKKTNSLVPTVSAEKKSELAARKTVWAKTLTRAQKSVSLETKNLGTDSSDDSAFSAGRRIWDIVSGRRKKGTVPFFSKRGQSLFSSSAPSSLTLSPKRDEDARPSALTAPLDPERVLSELRARPPSAIFFDYDKTLTEVNEQGISFPPAKNLVEGIKTLLKRGWPVAIITSRTFDRQPLSANFANTIEPLLSQIPESLREHLFFVGGAGSEFIAFKNGKPVRYLDRDWSEEEKAKIASIVDESLSELKISPEEVNISRDLPSQMLVRFNTHGDPRSTAFAELLDRKLKERGLLFPVIHGGDFVYFNKFDKGMGAALIYSAMRQKGFPVLEDNLLFVGDEFHMFPNGTMGGDAKMALAFPKSLAITVGKDLRGTLPPSVLWLGGRTSGTNLVMQELLKISAPKREGVLSRKARNLAVASLAAGGLGGILLQPAWTHFLHHPMTALGTTGTVLLSSIGIPQIVKNFKLKDAATKDLSLMGGLIWSAVSSLFLALSLIQHGSPFWISSNLAGLLESSVLVSQILLYSPRGGRGGVSALSALGATSVAILGGIAFPGFLFWTSMALLTVLNIPQIAANFKLYHATQKSPEGLSPLLSVLVVAGSALSLAVAAAQGNFYWILPNIVSILMSTMILAQIYFPKYANSILAKALLLRP